MWRTSSERSGASCARRRRIRACAVLALAGLACVWSGIEPIRDATFEPDEDERALWAEAAKFHRAIASQELLLADDELDAYLESVARRVLATLGAADAALDVRVVRNPLLNAAALPDGVLYLHTGILARIENEHELATLLGHEIAHYVRRHALAAHRANERRETGALIAASVFAVLGAAGGDPRLGTSLVGLVATPILAAQSSGYSRDLEREADERGIRGVAAAGYDPSLGIELFAILERDAAEEELNARVQDPYYYSSHPSMTERVASSREIADELRDEAPRGATARDPAWTVVGDFEARVHPLLLPTAELDLALGRRGAARRGVERLLRATPDDEAGWMMLGRIHRASLARPESFAGAVDAYENAVRCAPESADAHRELGLLYHASGAPRAREVLERYLELAPEAIDRALIESYIAGEAGSIAEPGVEP